jgi:endogenous inhibitor of DNA gyrase (YacG/DUF329 family)
MTTKPTSAERRVPCPTCRQPALFSLTNPYRPFCSERCSGVDLGAWASEDYRVASNKPPDPDEPDGTESGSISH